MENHIFDEMVGKRVSVLVDHPIPKSNLKESYVGTWMGRKDGFVYLSITGEKAKLSNVLIREDMVLSVWVYSESFDPKFNYKYHQKWIKKYRNSKRIKN